MHCACCNFHFHYQPLGFYLSCCCDISLSAISLYHTGTIPTNTAGFWGDYACDPPLWLVESAFQYLASVQDTFDWIYVTGDLPPHDVWSETRESVVWNWAGNETPNTYTPPSPHRQPKPHPPTKATPTLTHLQPKPHPPYPPSTKAHEPYNYNKIVRKVIWLSQVTSRQSDANEFHLSQSHSLFQFYTDPFPSTLPCGITSM